MARMDSYSWGASASRRPPSAPRKRPPPPPLAHSDMTKRLKSCPFVEDSDSEDDDASSDINDDEFNSESHTTVSQRSEARSTNKKLCSPLSRSDKVRSSGVRSGEMRRLPNPETSFQAATGSQQVKSLNLEQSKKATTSDVSRPVKNGSVFSQSSIETMFRAEASSNQGKGLPWGRIKQMVAAKRQGTITPFTHTAGRATPASKVAVNTRPNSAANSSSIRKDPNAAKEQTSLKAAIVAQNHQKPALVRPPRAMEGHREHSSAIHGLKTTPQTSSVGSNVPVAVMVRPERRSPALSHPGRQAQGAECDMAPKKPSDLSFRPSTPRGEWSTQSTSQPASKSARPPASLSSSPLTQSGTSVLVSSPLTTNKSPRQTTKESFQLNTKETSPTTLRCSPQTTAIATSPLDSNSVFKVAEKSELPSLKLPKQTASETSALVLPAEIKLGSPKVSPLAEPYFEYTIHQSIKSSDSGAVTSEISAQPLMSPDLANSKATTFLQNAKQQFEVLRFHCTLTTSRTDSHGLSIHEAAFSSVEDPSQTFSLHIWIERAGVGTLANRTPSASSMIPLVCKTVYAVRLWKLLDVKQESDSESESDSTSGSSRSTSNHPDKERIHHPLPSICSEIHTTLESANRAAKRVQIHLSHVQHPKRELDKQWQLRNLQELGEKLERLRQEIAVDDRAEASSEPLEDEGGRVKGCWWSKFSDSELQEYEVLVCGVGLSGPRNL